MAPPNIRTIKSIVGKTAAVKQLGTSASTILSNSSGSDDVYKINSIFAANRTGNTATAVSISHYDGSNDAYLAYNIDVPADATQIISTKETYFYLEEGQSIRAFASASSNIDVIISYELLTNGIESPNIINPSNITGKTTRTINLSTSHNAVLTNSTPNTVYKINSIFAANKFISINSDVTVSYYTTSLGHDVYLAYTINVPAGATQIISTKETYFYLESGTSAAIRASSTNSSSMDLIISYEIIAS
jgi:hypothetical protein